MKTTIKIILLALISAVLAILAEQLVAVFVNIFQQKEIVLESYAHFTWFLALAALIEEISKYWAVAYVVRKNFGLERRDFILAALLFGTAWGAFEIGLVLFANAKALSEFQAGNPTILFSFATIIALHALTAYLMGIFVATEIFSSPLKNLKNLLFPVLTHLLFNFLAIQKSSQTDILTIIVLVVLFLIGTTILVLRFRKLA